ncbi:type VII secretion protein EccB [Nocardiopsis sp. MG754419]|uniref:type VII secretion protein EccB n=1 Tax=Nocardiopsis sp. MG754419 TaxID=2259865 RepID=UPI001BAC699C|nr:type VII secretion protein EccB [Nocardiopsis sp. MG754419]MBR8743370.1 type VII secretion protein EccB [Nocardiopsis sp. MG754419]
MQTRRDQVVAHNFMVGRLGTAMLEANPDAIDAPMQRTRNGTYIGLAISVLLCVGFLVFGLLFPGGNTAWRNEGSLVLERESGATYLYSDGVLRPVANYASARLVQGNQINVRSVSADSLAGVPKGGPVGIPGAPDSLPDPDAASSALWRVCAVPPANRDGDPRTALTVDSTPDGGALPVEFAVLVQGPDADHHLLWNGTRLRLDEEHGALQALGYGTSPALGVSRAFLDVVPAGSDLAAPEVPGGAGAQSAPIGGEGRTTGQVFVVRDDEERDQYYLLGDDGLVPVSAVQSRLALADARVTDDAYGDASPEPIALSAGEVQRNLAADAAVADNGLPATPPELATVDGQAPCMRIDADGDAQLIVHPLDAVNAWPVQDRPYTAHGCPTADLIGIPAGGGAVVQAAPAGGTAPEPTYHLVTDTVTKYPLTSADTAGELGYSADSAALVPIALLRLLPTGPQLSSEAAGQPVPATVDRPSAVGCGERGQT